MAPDAADGATSSPEPSGDLLSIDLPDMTESMVERSQSDDKSPSTTKEGDSAAKRNAKDPSRPRRKKARRACYACQRAHLTCGDERPCNRCIKRGLADHCHDGVRKKAKYLHDAPNDALLPGAAAPYTVPGAQQTSAPLSAAHQHSVSEGQAMSQPGSYYHGQSNYTNYGQTPASATVNSPSTQQDSPNITQYGRQQSNMVSAGYASNPAQQVTPSQSNMVGINQTPPANSKPFATPLFDPSDPSIFNFDISTFNFGNHYGAMEFGMLGHMSSGAVETPDVDNNMMNPVNQAAPNSVSFDSANNAYPTPSTGFPYTNPYSTDWSNNANQEVRHGSTGQVYPSQGTGIEGGNGFEGSINFPNAFAIADGNGSISSASPSAFPDYNTGYATSPGTASNTFHNQNNQGFTRSQSTTNRQQGKGFLSTGDSTSRKKRRDPSEVYYTVTAPYSYTTGFHCLIAFVSKRFNPQKTLRIAKALASIRPSFISCSNKLTNDDLIFMEKLFQRTLYEYEGYMHALGTPTVLFRRTGEVASASKEFSLLSGWRKDVLLGQEPNLNVNTGGTSGVLTGTSTRGAVTPRVPDVAAGAILDRPQSVFLAELIDEDSVIGFYEDFAKHAFGDARGTVSRRCKLLKYRTKEDPGWGHERMFSSSESSPFGDNDVKTKKPTSNPLIMGEDGINALGVRDGKVDCMLSWTIKRDPFDVPMIIIINFLPII